MTAEPTPADARRVPLLNPANVLTGLRIVLIPVFLVFTITSEMTRPGWYSPIRLPSTTSTQGAGTRPCLRTVKVSSNASPTVGVPASRTRWMPTPRAASFGHAQAMTKRSPSA